MALRKRFNDDKTSRLLSKLGLPRRYHKPNVGSVYFSPITSENDTNLIITPNKQADWLLKVRKMFKSGKPTNVKALILSRPTDDSAMKTASIIMLDALGNNYSAKAINLGYYRKEDISALDYDVLILYSVNSISTGWKLDLVRDILKKADDSAIFVVATSPIRGSEARGCIEFNNRYLNFKFNGLLEIIE